jgi:dihydroxyacid dehydratase/phosphogluconate dehydratase
MATILEVIGLCPFGMASVPQPDDRKKEIAYQAGRLIVEAVKKDLKPRQICTKEAFENAIASVAASGGSTNAVLHLLAMAHDAGVELDIDEFQKISNSTPLYCDLRPAGTYTAVDVDRAGGIPVIAKRLLDGGFLHKECIHNHGPHHRRRSGRGQGDAGPASDQAGRRADQEVGRSRHSQRHACAGRLRHQRSRHREEDSHRTGPRVRS